MADPYDILIKVKAQLDEIHKFLGELRAVGEEISKINGLNFSAVSKSAMELSEITKALAEAAVSSKETFDKLKDATDKVGESSKKFRDENRKTKEGVGGLRDSITGFYMELGALSARFATQLPSAITKSIQAFGQQEMAVSRLAASIRSHGGNVSEVLPIMQNFASEMQRITTYGDEQVIAMQAMAASMGISAEQMQGVIRSAIGLSAALKMDVMTAVKAASAAMQGKTTALQEYIPALSKCKTEEEKLAIVQKLSSSGFAQAKAEAETSVGKLKQLANAWGDLAETVGGQFAPAAADVADLLKGMCGVLAENKGFATLLTESLAGLAIALTFSRIGGLAGVSRMFRLVSLSINGTTLATKTLSAALKATPWGAVAGLATAAVMGLASAYSYFAEKSREAYKKSIEASAQYRAAIDEEVAYLKQWGITLDGNKKNAAEVAAEIAKLAKERNDYERANLRNANTGSMGGISGYVDPNARAQLNNYDEKIKSLKGLLAALAPAENLAATAAKQHAAAVERSNAILAESEAKLRAATDGTEALRQIRQKYADTEREIADIEAAFGGGTVKDSERVAKSNRLAQARREILELGKAEAEQVLKNGENERTAETLQLLSRKLSLEIQIADAKNRGDSDEVKRLQSLSESVAQDLRRAELAKQHINSLKDTVKTEGDYADLKKRAYASAEAALKVEREKADAEKWLSAETAASKTRQQGLEMDILRARASGNETLAKELEGSQRVAQLASEIFENARREGMSRDELVALQNSANAQARERYNLEKSISDEAERQNAAKDAQAKIEDILTENKIEQLKAQGKMAEAQTLERESQMQRKLDSMQGVSDEDKEKLRATMRQTYAYKDAQREQAQGTFGGMRSGGSQGSWRSGGGGSAGGAEVSSAVARKNSMMAGGGFGGGSFGSTGGSPRQSGRPATVSAKYGDLYDQWKAAGGSKSGQSWTAFRDANKDTLNAHAQGKQTAGERKMSGYAQGAVGNIRSAATSMTSRAPQGVVASAGTSQGGSAVEQKKNASAKSKQATPATADAALGQELQKRGTDGDKGGDLKKDTDNIEKMTKALNDCLEALKDIKNNTAATATKKENK